MDEDAAAFDRYWQARTEETLKRATEIPLEIAEHCIALAEIGIELYDWGFKNARGEASAATLSAIAGGEAAEHCARLNLEFAGAHPWAAGQREGEPQHPPPAARLPHPDRGADLRDGGRRGADFDVPIPYLWLPEHGRAAAAGARPPAGRGVRRRRSGALALHLAPRPRGRPPRARRPGGAARRRGRRGDRAPRAAAGARRRDLRLRSRPDHRPRRRPAAHGQGPAPRRGGGARPPAARRSASPPSRRSRRRRHGRGGRPALARPPHPGRRPGVPHQRRGARASCGRSSPRWASR